MSPTMLKPESGEFERFVNKPPLRVERALQLVPELDALRPLRELLLATAHAQDGAAAGSARYLTVGKRHVQASTVRSRLPGLLNQVTDHLAVLYDAVVHAIELQQHGDDAGAVRALLRAGVREEHTGRMRHARVWYELALRIATALRERGPEIDALQRLGEVCGVVGAYLEGARWYERSLVLAEAELLADASLRACRGMGNMASGRGRWDDAGVWYGRGLALAETARDEAHIGQFHHSLGRVAQRMNDMDGALARFQEARRVFARLGEAEEMVRVLISQGLLEAERGFPERALDTYRTALMWLGRANHNPWLEANVRVYLARLVIEGGRLAEAEEELRRCEQIAIAGSFTLCLVRVYALIGKLRGVQRDEDGFVFFEKAIELCRSPEHLPLLEGQVLHEYALFRRALGDNEEAREYMVCARTVLETLGATPELQRVAADLASLPR